ncbi:hypothetical protein BGZ61DRAFT_210132 [Ilyonectria robusta]|uniref:uncharacterized protein n=1 Tax=Ilyonectria robusta TaxID=1079257 RepID=UPI001E8E1DE7|nr:uncharacterized protein BGZ61DRAFT_210132 [Ilyonectria robusta]KAH8714349.1 hypothetical protein BGZ61DRAFT_210132 [Ilyonectria robusta]
MVDQPTSRPVYYLPGFLFLSVFPVFPLLTLVFPLPRFTHSSTSGARILPGRRRKRKGKRGKTRDRGRKQDPISQPPPVRRQSAVTSFFASQVACAAEAVSFVSIFLSRARAWPHWSHIPLDSSSSTTTTRTTTTTTHYYNKPSTASTATTIPLTVVSDLDQLLSELSRASVANPSRPLASPPNTGSSQLAQFLDTPAIAKLFLLAAPEAT